jgi:MFS family permease
MFHVIDGKIAHYRELYDTLAFTSAISGEDRAASFDTADSEQESPDADQREAVADLCPRTAGKDPDDVRIVARGAVHLRSAGAADRIAFTGSLDEIADDIDQMARSGATELFLDLNFDDQFISPTTSPEAAMGRAWQVLEAFAPAGALSDRIGASRSVRVGVSLFTVASAVCGGAPDLGVLIGARVVQGAMAALLLPASLALLARAPKSEPRPAPLDLPGQATAVVAMAALTFAIIEGGRTSFGSLLVIAALAVFAVAAVMFVVTERRTRQPMVPLTLFRLPVVTVCTLTGLALNLAFYGLVFLLSLYFQQQRGMSALAAGLAFLPMTALVAGANLAAGKLAGRFGPRLPLVAGQVILAAGLAGLLSVTTSTSIVVVGALLLPVGLGGGLAIPPLTSALVDAIPADRAGLAGGILNAGRQLGGCLGVALFGALIAPQLGFLHGMRISLLIGVIALLLCVVAAVVWLPRPDPEDPAASTANEST